MVIEGFQVSLKGSRESFRVLKESCGFVRRFNDHLGKL